MGGRGTPGDGTFASSSPTRRLGQRACQTREKPEGLTANAGKKRKKGSTPRRERNKWRWRCCIAPERRSPYQIFTAPAAWIDGWEKLPRCAAHSSLPSLTTPLLRLLFSPCMAHCSLQQFHDGGLEGVLARPWVPRAAIPSHPRDPPCILHFFAHFLAISLPTGFHNLRCQLQQYRQWHSPAAATKIASGESITVLALVVDDGGALYSHHTRL
ncbi:hypothetical protein MRX96_059220 [Rhipicephalus microplus]